MHASEKELSCVDRWTRLLSVEEEAFSELHCHIIHKRKRQKPEGFWRFHHDNLAE